jgi:hypothetical protein
MKCTFASYEHSTIGFPGAVLKWSVSDGWINPAYITVNGIIQPGDWKWRNPYPLNCLNYELGLFDEWVRQRFAHDTTVQG